VLAVILFGIGTPATGAAIFQIAARLGTFGLEVKGCGGSEPACGIEHRSHRHIVGDLVLFGRCVVRAASSIFDCTPSNGAFDISPAFAGLTSTVGLALTMVLMVLETTVIGVCSTAGTRCL
jgi:hypothetical protein